jgi:hypothetical protein
VNPGYPPRGIRAFSVLIQTFNDPTVSYKAGHFGEVSLKWLNTVITGTSYTIDF